MSNCVHFLDHCFGYSLIVLAHDRPIFLLNSVDSRQTLKLVYFLTRWGSYKLEPVSYYGNPVVDIMFACI
jgi:hypothetical protein